MYAYSGFAGTPQFAAEHLKILVASDHHIGCILTQPDRRSGRGKQIKLSPVKEVGLEKSHYECHYLKNDKYFGYVFDGNNWSNPLREGTKAWFKRRAWEKEQAALAEAVVE